MVKFVFLMALITSVLGAPAPILYYSNTRGFAMFTDLPFFGGLLLQSAVTGGILFFAVFIGGLASIAIARGVKWVLA